ncbi:flagellar brake protein [Thalassomonas viridans]|uniref:Flagellar brake protein n=1 Tax=Thalassomonas viridans TaxID=137584 RepID=A0AAF0CAZ6_9GAMM|nr:PilZ domain-containing protein [Thalassomonas viridans]WDE06254.1 flagellar brake protein [Thalassomonas viridans]
MVNKPTQVDMISRLNRNLGLLQAGAVVTIDVSTPAGQKGKFRTTFIGYLPKNYVLIQIPDASKLGNFGKYIYQGAKVTVRGLIEGREGAVVAFVSEIRQTLQIPSRLLVLDFPKQVTLQKLRTSIRIDTEIIAKVKVKEEYWTGIITDLSVSGCQLQIVNGEELILLNEDVIELTIEDEQAENTKLEAKVCNSKQLSNGISFGLEFSGASLDAVTGLLHESLDTKTE